MQVCTSQHETGMDLHKWLVQVLRRRAWIHGSVVSDSTFMTCVCRPAACFLPCPRSFVVSRHRHGTTWRHVAGCFARCHAVIANRPCNSLTCGGHAESATNNGVSLCTACSRHYSQASAAQHVPKTAGSKGKDCFNAGKVSDNAKHRKLCSSRHAPWPCDTSTMRRIPIPQGRSLAERDSGLPSKPMRAKHYDRQKS